MNLKTITARLVLLALALHFCTARAVCLDPKTFISGYKVPLDSEVRTADAIVVARVLSEQGLNEDPTDPDGYTAYNLTIRVLTSLKGKVPTIVVIKNENTSARYPMSVGEEHILFVSRNGNELWINSCGNSAAMPKGKQLVKQIQAKLQKLKQDRTHPAIISGTSAMGRQRSRPTSAGQLSGAIDSDRPEADCHCGLMGHENGASTHEF